MKKFNSIILSLLILVNITSCGYQFRGATEMNFVSISIDGGSPSFLKTLKKQFKQSGVKVQ